MPGWIRKLGVLYSSCVSGAIPKADYLAGLRKAGLVGVGVKDRLVYERDQLAAFVQSELLDGTTGCCCSAPGPGSISREKLESVLDALAGKVASVRVVGRKPRAAK
jgi:hypothetical protein